MRANHIGRKLAAGLLLFAIAGLPSQIVHAQETMGCCGQRMIISGDPKWSTARGNLTAGGLPVEEGFAAELHGQGIIAKANLPEGVYTVEIAGAENTQTSEGKRIFDVRVNGETVAKDVDIFAKAGAGKSYTVRAKVRHPGGQLKVALLARTDDAKFSVIRILDATGAKAAWAIAEDLKDIEDQLLPENPPVVQGPEIWKNPDAGTESRVADLLRRMSVREKVAQMDNDAPAIERLGVPAYNYWNECLHGIGRNGPATVFPQAIGMGASWDPDFLHTVADVISTEGRAKHYEALAKDQHAIYQGLTFWTPNINLFRDPRWGRGQETYGEDPYLTGRMGVAFIKGLQGDDPKYFKLVATAKHFAVHSGPEPLRHTFDAVPPERDFYEYYLPHFEAAIREGHAFSVMGAYNRVYGAPACASDLLLEKTLREEWGFDGYVVSDCRAIQDIWQNHKVVATRAEAAALAVKAGCDLECGIQYPALVAAVDMGLITEKDLDLALGRILTARFRLGMFDPAERVPWSKIKPTDNDTPEHDAVATEMARKSIVLLKNNGILPLKKDIRKLAVVGPNADWVLPLVGNYNGTATRPVTILDGIKKAFPNTEITYVRGCDVGVRKEMWQLVPDVCLRTGAQTGLKGEYFDNQDLIGTPSTVRNDKVIDLTGWLRDQVAGIPLDRGSVRWTGDFVAPSDGVYRLLLTGSATYRMWVGEKVVADQWYDDMDEAAEIVLDLKAGQSVPLRIEAHQEGGAMTLQLMWNRTQTDTQPLAAKFVQDADAIIFVGGYDGRVEAEEGAIRAQFHGFVAGDRDSIELPRPQTEMMQILKATGKPVIFVNLTGSAVAIPWEAENLDAILQAWYPGQSGGRAVADVFTGDYNPAGRLPVTFYRSTGDLPDFTDYAVKDRTYLHFTGKPLWAFGHGLSYTHFSYANVGSTPTGIKSDGIATIAVDVKNDGQRDGEEVIQVYSRAQKSAVEQPIHRLVAFKRIALKSGETRRIELPVRANDLRYWDVANKRYVVEHGAYTLEVGAASDDIRVTTDISVQ